MQWAGKSACSRTAKPWGINSGAIVIRSSTCTVGNSEVNDNLVVADCRTKAPLEPLRSESSDLAEGAWFFEEVAGARDDR